ncbi:Coiled-coil domain-containing protein 87 [Phlyctochytrium planicorne]|nr:Coiled-coil domain-containing protein 87 [Phlyctochytrium planicorne]
MSTSEKYGLRHVFSGAELTSIKFLEKAISNAEHRHVVRGKLGKGAPGEQFLRHQKYGKILGVLGYDQLPLKPLTRIEVSVRSVEVTSFFVSKEANVKSESKGTCQMLYPTAGRPVDQSITTLLKKLIGEIEIVGWLDPDEREQLVNTFISDLAYRYNSIQHMVMPGLTAQQNRTLITKVFERIGAIKSLILERCRFKKAVMDRLAMFSPDANSCRVISLFRTELHKRVNTVSLLRDASIEMDKGIQENDNSLPRFDKFKHEIQEFKDALDSVIHPIPRIEPPKLTQKSQNIVNRRKLMMENASKASKTTMRETNFALLPSKDFLTAQSREKNVEVFRDLLKILEHQRGLPGNNIFEDDSGDEEIDPELHIGDETPASLDNPVLQAHTLSSHYERRKERKFEPITQPKRYLSEDHYHKETLAFDYAAMDTLEQEILGKNIDNVFSSFSGPNKMLTRPMESRVSLRVPKGFITLSAEPAAAVSEFGSEVDSKLINSLGNISKTLQIDSQYLDEKLSRFKEVEELYEEIMKTHQPASPLPEEEDEEFDAVMSPSIRLRTRDRSGIIVSPDDFIKDRAAAMRKAPSSRYHVLKYNYGGYIPYDIDKKKKKKVEVFNPSDYIDYLRTRTCDFIMDLLVDREKDDETMRKLLEEQERLRSLEEENRRIQEERERKKDRVRHMTEYKDGLWNAGTLDYMQEVQDPDVDTIAIDAVHNKGLKPDSRGSSPSRSKSPSNRRSKSADRTNDDSHSQIKKLEESNNANLDILEAQHHLERLWVSLKMPVDQKLDMAIKYGSAKFSQKLKTAIELWETAQNYIMDREALLKEIEHFEHFASDPQRFFKKGYEGSSEARMQESKSREEYLRKLHYLEARLQDIISMIKYELNETVTFQGVPYLEKIKTDYSDMIRKIQIKRAAEIYHGIEETQEVRETDQ